MKTLPTPEELREMFHYDRETGVLTWSVSLSNRAPVGTMAGTYSRRYRSVTINRVQYRVHQVIWALETGVWPNQEIDHIDGDRSNNKIGNLRLVTRAENMKNTERSSKNTSGVTGVSWRRDTRKWHAYIKVGGTRTSIGCYNSLEEAAAARKYEERALGFHQNHGRERS